MGYDLLVFDLDGTLIDSAPDIIASVERTLARLGRPAVGRDLIRAAIGNGVRKLIERTTPPPIEPVIEEFMREYGAHLLDGTRLYPGVAETLAALPHRKIILTNKPVALSRRIVEGLGIARHFEAVHGGDSFPVRKPDPACFRAAVGAAKNPLMIGDSGTDIETARNAGVPFCGVSYGYWKPGEIGAAERVVDRFDQLLGLLR